MSTTVQAYGGGAKPASIDTSGKIAGGVARRVYGFDSEADALAAGFVCEGGPAVPVALITDAQIASGEWKAEGDPSAMVVYTAPSSLPVVGGLAVPVYSVNGWGSAPAPAGPQFVSAEVGTVNASTVAVTFDRDVSAADYSAGVTINVNGTATSITSATRQSNHAIVYYVVPVLWHGSGDVVTWEYASGSGDIVAESDSASLGDVTAQTATNNCEYNVLLDLQADMLALSDTDPVSLWSDQSGNGNDFTGEVGTARIYHAGGGNPYVDGDGESQFMTGPDFADNLGVLIVMIALKSLGWGGHLIDKLYSDEDNTFYYGLEIISFDEIHLTIQLMDGADAVGMQTENAATLPAIITFKKTSNAQADLKIFENGVEQAVSPTGIVDSVDTYTTTEPWRIGVCGGPGGVEDAGYSPHQAHAYMIISPIPNATNLAALEARLAARYGITL